MPDNEDWDHMSFAFFNFLSILILFETTFGSEKKHAYQAVPAMRYEELLADEYRFRKMVMIPSDVFHSEIVEPCYDYLLGPRSPYANVSRGYQLSPGILCLYKLKNFNKNI